MNKKIFLPLLLLLTISCTKDDAVPIYDYYKNIPIIRGWTRDEEPKNLIIEVVLVYRENNNELRNVINDMKPQLIDSLRGYFSTLKEEDYLLKNQEKVKREAVDRLNNLIMTSFSPRKAEKLRNKKDLEELDLLLDIDIMQLQIFSLD